MLDISKTALIVIDVQGVLASQMANPSYLNAVESMIRAAKILELELSITEQAPHKIGSTIQPIRDLCPDVEPLIKSSCSCLGEFKLRTLLLNTQATNFILVGIETHVCVFQTAHDLIQEGKTVHILADAVSSQRTIDHDIALHRCRDQGVIISTTQMAIMELVKTADHPKFREIIQLIKNY